MWFYDELSFYNNINNSLRLPLRRINDYLLFSLQSQAMKIVKTVGQAFEVCHKISLQKNPKMDHGDDCSETPCDTSEQDKFSEVISQDDEDEFESIPRKGKSEKNLF